METTFDALIAPLRQYLKENSQSIDKISGSRKFLFEHFTFTIIFAYLMQIPSLRKISNKTQHNETAKRLGIRHFAWTTVRDGFTRFSQEFFIDLYRSVLKNSNLIRVQAVDELGLISLVDGSIFPTISNMCWAEYKTTKRAIRLQMEMSLNQMVPTEFVGQKANASERDFLLSILRQGVTYIADRGYFSFDVANTINKAYAFFVLRLKNNMKYQVGKVLKVTGKIPPSLKNVTDELVRFTNDKHQKVYRIITFKVVGSQFMLCTNRLDLTTLDIIQLYAYRWQVELLFKFIKRVIGGIHLFNHSKNGVNIQFCLLMTMSVLYLSMRQFCKVTTVNVKKAENGDLIQIDSIENFNTYWGHSPDKWITSINQPFQSLWKISSYWIENLKDKIDKPFDYQVIRLLAQ